jgi:catechol 2,3-dioxygenase-like lactoylglutathione lyase family enzyme
VLSDDIDATRDFYVDVVGLHDGARPPLVFPGHWLYADDGGASCLHIAQRDRYRAHAASIGIDGRAVGSGPDGPPGPGDGAVDHVAFDADGHDAALAAIARRGLRAVVNETPGGPRQLFVADPNGVLVEINVKPGGPA